MVELPDDLALGPKMAALPNDRQRRFALLMSHGVLGASECARRAGYADNGSLGNNEKGGVRVQAHKLAHDPKVLDAIEECTRATLRGLGPIAVRHAGKILEDPSHPAHARMIETVLDRAGYFARSEHTVKVEHSLDTKELEELARRLAKESGISPEKLLGTTKSLPSGADPGVIEGEVVADGTDAVSPP
jgi:hypothetical protein